jgi:hypothetical protein
MSSQYEIPVSDASAKAPARSGILTPASENSLNLSDDASSGSKKRKRDGSTTENLLEESFLVKVGRSPLKHEVCPAHEYNIAISNYGFRKAAHAIPAHAIASIEIILIISGYCIFCKPVTAIATLRNSCKNIGTRRAYGKPAHGAYCSIRRWPDSVRGREGGPRSIRSMQVGILG